MEFPKNPLRMLTVEIVPRVSERSITERIERTRWAWLGTKGDLERMRKFGEMEGQNRKKERAREGWFRDLRISEASVGVREREREWR